MSTQAATDTGVFSTLEPQPLWHYFAQLNSIPRGSKKEERVSEWMREFGQGLGLETIVDEVGNVLIRKPATAGMEASMPVVLQSHLDMVWQKNSDTDFDFETEGIRMLVDGDWVRADGTTLGADNGIGVAAIMSVLAANDLAHPAVEGLFTIDEETGMTGAKALQPGWLQGKILLNLDTESDDELTIGCAGGVDVTANQKYLAEETPAGVSGFRLSIKGLTGGHSGMDIHLGRGNANKWMNRLLWNAAQLFPIRIHAIDGGGLRNAIPRESSAIITVCNDSVDEFKAWLESAIETICAEYRTTDPAAEISLEPLELPKDVMPQDLQAHLTAALYGVPSGIHRMSPDVEGLVQTSNNLARVLIQDGQVNVQCLTRSSVNSERDDLANAIAAVIGLTGAEVEFSGDYPGWTPAPDSDIVRLMASLHEELFGSPAHVAACHAGLECGIIGAHYPDMQMISFGPNIRGAHSPDEKVQISSVQKFWRFLTETLRRIPASA